MTPKLLSNTNYAAQIAILPNPVPHPNADKLEGFVINGNTVWYSKNLLKAGDKVIYFPIECQINPMILSNLNLFAEKTLNKNQEEKGYFDSKGRVKALRLRGEPSEGFILPVSHLYNALVGKDLNNHPSKYPQEDLIFDTIDDTWICRKYVPVAGRNSGKGAPKSGKVKVSDILVANQFRFHYDTEKLQNNLHKISPEDWIVITKKLHGTSAVFANVLTKIKFSFWDEILAYFSKNAGLISVISIWLLGFFVVVMDNVIWFLGLMLLEIFISIVFKPYRIWKLKGLNISKSEYSKMCSSRSVIKSIDGKYHTKEQGYYNTDIWGLCFDAIKDKIEPGITLYGEIVGYMPGGKMVQKGYDYGFISPTTLNFDNTSVESFRYDINYGFFVYRITHTNSKGDVLEYSWEQIKQYCVDHNLNPVPELLNGTAMHYTGGMENAEDIEGWGKEFFDSLRKDTCFELEELDSMCKNKVPAEGICIRRETRGIKAFKLKSFRFLEQETKDLDAGEVDTETIERDEEVYSDSV